jgi:alkanesulfonate monooxygenase SsuD/methylene tetrahydromethanopterin reductase-like flavin-dependent oxidoreductase (luciferase family)
VAAYGPKALTLAGRVADGVILQLADPAVIEWCLGFVRAGAEAAGRDPEAIHVQCAAPLLIGDDLAEMREIVRWFPAVVGNHIADLLRHHKPASLPAVLTDYVQGRTDYDYRDHTRPGADHADYVPDEIVDRFTVIGTADRCIERLRELERIGVDEMNVYAKVERPADLVRAIGEQLVPALREPSRASALGAG